MRRSMLKFSDAVARLNKAGAHISEEKLSLLDDMAQVNSKGGVQPAEAFSIHRDLLSRRADAIDPNVQCPPRACTHDQRRRLH